MTKHFGRRPPRDADLDVVPVVFSILDIALKQLERLGILLHVKVGPAGVVV